MNLLPSVNFLAVLVAAAVSFGSGAIFWIVIARPLTRLLGGKPETVPMPPAALIAALLTRIVLAYVLVIFLNYAGAHSALTGAAFACLACFGFVLTYRIGEVAFRPIPWSSFVVGFAEVLLGFALMGMVIGIWA